MDDLNIRFADQVEPEPEPQPAPEVFSKAEVEAMLLQRDAQFSAQMEALKSVASRPVQVNYTPTANEPEEEYDFTDQESVDRYISRKVEALVGGNKPAFDPRQVEQSILAKQESLQVVADFKGKVPDAMLNEVANEIRTLPNVTPEAVRTLLSAKAYEHMTSQPQVPAMDRTRATVATSDPLDAQIAQIPAAEKKALYDAHMQTNNGKEPTREQMLRLWDNMRDLRGF